MISPVAQKYTQTSRESITILAERFGVILQAAIDKTNAAIRRIGQRANVDIRLRTPDWSPLLTDSSGTPSRVWLVSRLQRRRLADNSRVSLGSCIDLTAFAGAIIPITVGPSMFDIKPA